MESDIYIAIRAYLLALLDKNDHSIEMAKTITTLYGMIKDENQP